MTDTSRLCRCQVSNSNVNVEQNLASYGELELGTQTHTHTHHCCSVEKLNNYALSLGFITSSLLCIYSNFAQHLVHMEPVSIKCQGVREHRIASTRLNHRSSWSGAYFNYA